ncbi:MAG: hypothetical protein PHT60_09550 [Acidiphilium sp.]|nr:hypothetical protein [Acidiphilium sp.]MDD4936007.1 hypothetical protein [Acidiphilium sp.]
MNDPETTSAAPVSPDPAPVATDPIPPIPTPPRRRRLPVGIIGVIGGMIGFLLLAGGEAWLFRAQTGFSDQASRIASLGQQVDRLKSRLILLEGKITTLANRPMPQNAPASAPASQPASLPASAAQASAAPVTAALDRKIVAVQASIAALSSTTLADHAAITDLQGQAAGLPKLVARAQSLALIAQASLALQNGDKLGHIPNAPEALVRYETSKPPTLGALKISFPAYARQAERAGGNVTAHDGFWRGVAGRIESLVTVRHHNDVLVGSRAAGILGAAQDALDHDDLAGTLAALKPLPPAAQVVMAPWTTQATRLLAARAALATMAEQN